MSGFSFILIQAVADRNFPTIEKTLKESGLSVSHSQILSENWQKFSSELTVKMREKPVAIREEVKEFNWSIQIPAENSKLPLKSPEEKIENYDELFSVDARNPSALLTFNLQNSDSNEKSKDFCVRLNKGQIQNLFENMEQLQEQIDLLT